MLAIHRDVLSLMGASLMRPCQPMSTHAYPCLPMPTHAYPCPLPPCWVDLLGSLCTAPSPLAADEDDVDFLVETRMTEEGCYSDGKGRRKRKRALGDEVIVPKRPPSMRRNVERPLLSIQTKQRVLIPRTSTPGGLVTPGARPGTRLGTWPGERPTLFTPEMYGQLYALIHEHCQLLVQVHLLALASRGAFEHVAKDTRSMLEKLVHQRGIALTTARAYYHREYFLPGHIRPSVPFEDLYNSQVSDYRFVPSVKERKASPSEASLSNMTRGHPLAEASAHWGPLVLAPVVTSMWDVAPLWEMAEFLGDIAGDKLADLGSRPRVPLFDYEWASTADFGPIRYAPVARAPDAYGSNNNSGAHDHADGTSPTKEGATKEGAGKKAAKLPSNPRNRLTGTPFEPWIALYTMAELPDVLVTAASRFAPLFNPALYPWEHMVHYPRRLVFTLPEDRLLAAGFKSQAGQTNWEQVRKLYLPGKTMEQAKCRHKNLNAVRSGDNPVKDAKEEMNMPLTRGEIELLKNGALQEHASSYKNLCRDLLPMRHPCVLRALWDEYLKTPGNASAAADERMRVWEERQAARQRQFARRLEETRRKRELARVAARANVLQLRQQGEAAGGQPPGGKRGRARKKRGNASVVAEPSATTLATCPPVLPGSAGLFQGQVPPANTVAHGSEIQPWPPAPSANIAASHAPIANTTLLAPIALHASTAGAMQVARFNDAPSTRGLGIPYAQLHAGFLYRDRPATDDSPGPDRAAWVQGQGPYAEGRFETEEMLDSSDDESSDDTQDVADRSMGDRGRAEAKGPDVAVTYDGHQFDREEMLDSDEGEDDADGDVGDGGGEF
eukprot:jgi/Mesvir1/2876/Mv13955-RA.3